MKFYAVRKGRTPGIYMTWPECQAQTNGFKGAEFKSFETREEAESYISGVTKQTEAQHHSYAFVDGSFNSERKVYGYGGFLVDNKGNKHKLQGSGIDPELASMRNVAGELMGAMAAIRKADNLGMAEVSIYYDYAGIEAWATGTWQCNKEGTKAYRDYVQSMRDKGMFIRYVKVKAHSGIADNEEADWLAKQAVGVL
ncbi:MAG: ribonuclease H family protein [Lachnospiraceae bacterium]|nr:ribonuclease H family protein [Lachnospiraceae bacterium]